jgi:hypothetical protein
MYIQCNNEACLNNHYYNGKAISITYSGYVFVDLVSCMQSTRTILLSVACPALQYIVTLSHKLHHLKKKILKIKLFWFSLQLLSETFLILRRTERDMIKNVNLSKRKAPIILVRFLWNLNFLNRVSKITQISNFMKIHQVGAALFYVDRQTHDKANGRISQFCEHT